MGVLLQPSESRGRTPRRLALALVLAAGLVLVAGAGHGHGTEPDATTLELPCAVCQQTAEARAVTAPQAPALAAPVATSAAPPATDAVVAAHRPGLALLVRGPPAL